MGLYWILLSQIPDELVEQYLAKSGFQCPDVRLYVLFIYWFFQIKIEMKQILRFMLSRFFVCFWGFE